jgi:kynurenine formamidase
MTCAGREVMHRSAAVLILTLAARPLPAQQLDLARSDLVDLTHAFNARTLYWPTSPTRFKLEQLSYGPTAGGYFYSAYTLSMPEHGGTHLDAPIHFAEKGATADQIPLSQLIAPAVVIDISAQAANDRDYRLTVADVRAFESVHGRIPAGTIVLLRTGWSRYWPDARTYLGDDTPGDASKLSFPSYGADAARVLVDERRVAALGADVASIDYGRSTDFMVHRVAMAANIPGFENLTNLDRLPPTGFLILALPMKIENGSGGPLRAVAVIPRGSR